MAPDALGVAAAVVDLTLFTMGFAAFVLAMVKAAARSRREVLSVVGVYFLSGSAPARTRRIMLGALGAQVTVALTTAAIRPYTALAFGVLVPLFGLGSCGVWAAFYGEFPERHQREPPVGQNASLPSRPRRDPP